MRSRARDAGPLVVEVSRERHGKTETFKQTQLLAPSLPLARLVLLYLLTGARQREILALPWADVDLAEGRITFRGTKHRGRQPKNRDVPLVGGLEGEVAPRLLRLLARWRAEDPTGVWVVPRRDGKPPVWPRKAWESLRRRSGVKLLPSGARSTFTSAAASLGIPTSVSTLWQGHTPQTATRYYRTGSKRIKGAKDFEEALGINKLMDAMLGETLTT